MMAPKKEKTRQGGKAESVSKTQTSPSIFTDLLESIKADLLAGQAVRLVDYLPDQRAQVIGAITALRDELPIRSGWQTVRESFLSETRLRARRYSIDGAFLNRESDHV